MLGFVIKNKNSCKISHWEKMKLNQVSANYGNH